MKICVIAGEGELPKLLAKENNEFIFISIIGLSNIKDFKSLAYNVELLDFNKIIEILKRHQITDIIFAGKFYRPKNVNESLSIELKTLVEESKYLGDDNLLRKIKLIFEKNGFNIISPGNVLKHNFKDNEILCNKNFYDKNKENYLRETVKISKKLLDTISKFDIGQAVVARKNHILGIEGVEGTNELIKRCGDYYNKFLKDEDTNGPILIKSPKLTQILDLDMPVIGFSTIKLAYELNFFGVAFPRNGVLLLDEKKIRLFCESKNFYIYCIGD